LLYRLSALLCIAAAALAYAVPAYAFDCTVAKKPAQAGAVGIVDVTTGEFTPLKRNPGTDEQAHGGFVALTDGVNSTSTFLHAPGGGCCPQSGRVARRTTATARVSTRSRPASAASAGSVAEKGEGSARRSLHFFASN
jgi:hypothetical protein